MRKDQSVMIEGHLIRNVKDQEDIQDNNLPNFAKLQ
jgi:hypothetical protein